MHTTWIRRHPLAHNLLEGGDAAGNGKACRCLHYGPTIAAGPAISWELCARADLLSMAARLAVLVARVSQDAAF